MTWRHKFQIDANCFEYIWNFGANTADHSLERMEKCKVAFVCRRVGLCLSRCVLVPDFFWFTGIILGPHGFPGHPESQVNTDITRFRHPSFLPHEDRLVNCRLVSRLCNVALHFFFFLGKLSLHFWCNFGIHWPRPHLSQVHIITWLQTNR